MSPGPREPQRRWLTVNKKAEVQLTGSSRAPHVAAGAAGRRDVGLEHVVHHHTVGAESPAKGPDCALHPGNPFARQAIAVAVVVQRDDLVAEDLEESLGIAFILNIG